MIISTILLTPAILAACYLSLPSKFMFMGVEKKPWHAFVCCVCGLWAGMLIGYFTETMTSHSYKPVRNLA